MRRIFFISIFINVFINCFSQVNNLVPNPSFEEYTQCPNDLGQIDFAYPWTEPNQYISKTSDYYNKCSNSIFMTFCNHIHARTGIGFSGIYFYSKPDFNSPYYYEYIEVKLKNKLRKTKRYCSSLYVILNYKLSQVGVDGIGLYFSDTYIYQDNIMPPLPRIIADPQISNIGNVIIDSISWTKVSGSFVSNNDELYLTIGNFFNGDSVNFISFYQSTPYPTSYYFIDDVSVCDCEDFKPKLGRDTTLCLGQQLLLKANVPKEADSVIYTWQDGSKDSTFLVTKTGTYWVSAYIEDYKITLTDSIRVNYTDCTPPPIWIPNSFTPNGDGLNDVFRIETLDVLLEYSMLIFNRWGQLIYESNEVTKGWDGKYKGKQVESGVYTYRIEALDRIEKIKKVYNGKVTVVR
jgi:gliding motility-associated-like protein